MVKLINNIQDRVKSSSNLLALFLLKVVTGLFVGLTLALILDQIINYGPFSFVLVIVVVAASLVKIMKTWTWTNVLIFNLICMLLGLLLRMYILIAPG